MTRIATAVAVLLLLSTSSALADADLRVTAKALGQYDFVIQVHNLGPDVARDVVLYIDTPSLRVFPHTLLNCNADVRPVRCFTPFLTKDLGTLEFTFQVQGPSPVVDATYPITGRVESASVDPDLSNNTATVHFETREMTAFFETVGPSIARVDPGAAHTFRTEVNNHFDSDARDVRIRYTATNAAIESIQPQDSRWSCTFSGAEGECLAPSLDFNCRCSHRIDVTLRASGDRSGGEAKLEMNATSALPDDYDDVLPPTEATLQTYRIFAVTTTADAGPGSLRDAMTQADASCTPGPCKIAFEIAGPVPPEGWFTIVPATELPVIRAQRVALDGTFQTRFSGDTNPRGPEVAIDGHLALRGLQLRSSCEAVVEGLAIGNFIGGDGLSVSGDFRDCNFQQPDRRLVTGNYIGVDPTGTVAWPNQRGLNIEGYGDVRENVISRNKWSAVWFWRGDVDFFRNTIEDNGKSGIVLGPETVHTRVMENRINRQAEMGVAVAPGAALYEIRANSMSGNGGLGIDIDIDGVSPSDDDDQYPKASNAPVLLSAVYDAGRDRTVVTMLLRSRRLGPYLTSTILDFYANAGPDGDGEQWVWQSQQAYPGGGETFQVELWGNFTGRWLNATSTRTHSAWAKPPDDKRVTSQDYTGEGYSTSELSKAVLVTPQ
jgi:Right handed beta helix region/Domain of unknown function DUF11